MSQVGGIKVIGNHYHKVLDERQERAEDWHIYLEGWRAEGRAPSHLITLVQLYVMLGLEASAGPTRKDRYDLNLRS